MVSFRRMNRSEYSGNKMIWEEEAMKNRISYSPEVRERAVRLVFEQQKEHESQWSVIKSIASKIDCTAGTLRTWVRRIEADQGIVAACRPRIVSDSRNWNRRIGN